MVNSESDSHSELAATRVYRLPARDSNGQADAKVGGRQLKKVRAEQLVTSRAASMGTKTKMRKYMVWRMGAWVKVKRKWLGLKD